MRGLLRGRKSDSSSESQVLDKYSAHRKFKVEGELYLPSKLAKGKTCKFIECEFTFDIQTQNNHAVKIFNLLYDPAQENDEYCLIPINPQLEFFPYTGRDMDHEEIRGFSFYDKKSNHLFQLLPRKDQEADQLEFYMSQLLFETKTGNDFTSASKDELFKYCVYAFYNFA